MKIRVLTFALFRFVFVQGIRDDMYKLLVFECARMHAMSQYTNLRFKQHVGHEVMTEFELDLSVFIAFASISISK